MALQQCSEHPIPVWLLCLSLWCSAASQHSWPTPQVSLPLTSSAGAQKCPADPKPGPQSRGTWRGTAELGPCDPASWLQPAHHILNTLICGKDWNLSGCRAGRGILAQEQQCWPAYEALSLDTAPPCNASQAPVL